MFSFGRGGILKVFYIYIFILTAFFLSNTVFAQDDFQKWLKKDQQQFESFLSEEDKAFSDFLKQEWQPYQSEKGKKRDIKPKPVTLPVAKERDKAKNKPTPQPKTKPKIESKQLTKPNLKSKQLAKPRLKSQKLKKTKILKNNVAEPERPVTKPRPIPKLKSPQNALEFEYLGVPLSVDYKKDFSLNFSEGILRIDRLKHHQGS
jgi:outer membrane biosynthesis protein TonB